MRCTNFSIRVVDKPTLHFHAADTTARRKLFSGGLKEHQQLVTPGSLLWWGLAMKTVFTVQWGKETRVIGVSTTACRVDNCALQVSRRCHHTYPSRLRRPLSKC
uniref:Uncharacterized protein n=1 Tax=Schistocephalus solidus TaxID=70667 RepID=A0A0X3NPW0_SCHSO